MINAIETTQTTTPDDERRNDPRKSRDRYPGRELRLIGLRTQRTRAMTQQIDRLSYKLADKPGVMGRLEQVLANANEEIDRAIKNAAKFANRPESESRSWHRPSDSAELRSIDADDTDKGNG